MYSAGKQSISVGHSEPYARYLPEEPRIFGRNNYEVPNTLHYRRPTHYLRPIYTPNFRPQPTLSPHLNARTLYVHPELSHR